MARELLGREAEIERIGKCLETAAEGNGGALLLIGEPGIGKTALMDAACANAEARGFRVLRGAAVMEAAEPFNVLNTAFGPVSERPLFEAQGAVAFAEVMAINPAGLLMAKASKAEGGIDADIFAGMLTAVQSFVRDSFGSSGGQGAGLGRLEYGDMKILIENGERVSLTAVLVGQEHQGMAAALRASVRTIENEYGAMLSSWSGNMREAEPIAQELRRLAETRFVVRRDISGMNLESEIARISEDALAALQEACGSGPVLLALEDLHWAAESSLRVLEYVARNAGQMRCLVIGSARTAESGPFEQIRSRMAAEGSAEEMRLEGFGGAALRRMLDEKYTPNSFPESLYGEMLARTRGNPLFALELARHLEDTGAISMSAGRYVFTEAAATIPETVEDVISGRLDRLTPDLLALVEAASCIGREFDMSVLRGIRLIKATPEAAAALESAGMMTFSGEEGAFSHGLFQEFVYSLISPRWKAKYHGALAEHYEIACAGRPDEVLFELARHYSNTTQHAKALHYCVLAGEKAEAGFAIEQAIGYYEKALAACGTDKGQRSMLNDRIGDLMFVISDIDGACAYYAEVLALAQDDAARAEALRKRADAFEKKSDYASAMEEAGKGLEIMSATGAPVEARLLMSVGRVHMRQGDYAKALENLERAARLAEGHGVKADQGMAEHLLGTVHLHRGEYKEALERFSRAAEIREAIGDPRGRAASLNNIGNVYARTGEWAKALEYYKSSAETDVKLGDRLGLASSLTNIATVHLSTGHPDDAIPILEESIAIERKIGDRRGLAISLLNLNLAHYLKKDYGRALAILGEALGICESSNLKYECIFCYNGMCELYSLTGRTAEGLEYARKSLALSREMGTKEGEAMSLLNLGSAQMESGALAEARENLEATLALMTEISHNQIPDANLSLGVLWMKLGDAEKAVSFLEAAMAGYAKVGDEARVEKCKAHVVECASMPGDTRDSEK